MPVVEKRTSPRLVLEEESARDLMAPDLVSIRDTATVEEAIVLLTDKGFSAAPVIDEAGHPVGVLSHSDILTHTREQLPLEATVRATAGEPAAGGAGLSQVRDLMTPAVFSVAPEVPAGQVVEQLLGLKVHQLFVIDRSGVLIGVITARDVLGHLRPEEP